MDSDVTPPTFAATAVVPRWPRTRPNPQWTIGHQRPEWRWEDMKPSSPDPDWPKTAWWY
jgi:hypothetical protein